MSAFQMPSGQTVVSRKSSIANAFISAIIPVIPPTHEETFSAGVDQIGDFRNMAPWTAIEKQ